MQEKPTNELDEMLENTKPGQLNAYFQENKGSMADEKRAFYYYMKNVLDEKRIKLKDVYICASVTEKYGGQILTMEKHTRDRDLILRFCIAGHFSLPETNRALKLYGMRELYAKDRRDACIIVAVNHRIYDLADIDELLIGQGEKRLTKAAPEE